MVLRGVGYVWRVNSAGHATFVAQMNPSSDDTFEGVTTCPNNVSEYGPFAGKILVGGDHAGDFFAIDTNGNVVQHNFPFGAEEHLDYAPQNENLYLCDDDATSVWGITADQFLNMTGDILIADEAPYYGHAGLYRLHWNGNAFNICEINYVNNDWEGITQPAGLLNLPPSGACS